MRIVISHGQLASNKKHAITLLKSIYTQNEHVTDYMYVLT